jgi:isoleucyl-tRNA synthetase
VYYSPSSRSALAEAELEYMELHISHPVYVLFDIDKDSSIENEFLRNIVSTEKKVQLAVWTTTPWTLSANMVRVNSHLLGSRADMLYASSRELRLIAVFYMTSIGARITSVMEALLFLQIAD